MRKRSVGINVRVSVTEKRKMTLIHHVQNFGNEIGQADIAADGFPTHASVFAHFLRSQLRHNLCRS